MCPRIGSNVPTKTYWTTSPEQPECATERTTRTQNAKGRPLKTGPDLRIYWSGCRDLNSGPSVPQTDALTKLRHSPCGPLTLPAGPNPRPGSGEQGPDALDQPPSEVDEGGRHEHPEVPGDLLRAGLPPVGCGDLPTAARACTHHRHGVGRQVLPARITPWHGPGFLCGSGLADGQDRHVVVQDPLMEVVGRVQ